MKWEQYIASLSWLNIRITKKKFEEWLGDSRLINNPKLLYDELDSLAKFRDKNDGFTWESYAREQVQWITDNGIGYSILGDPSYPESLASQEYPPLFLTYLGDRVWQYRESIAIVGSRKPNQNSMDWLQMNLPIYLQSRDYNIVSGGARGIDQKVHSICIQNNHPTLCFLPSGLDKIYPKALESWVQPIVGSGGVVVSTFAPKARMQKSYFHYRNHWIAQFSNFILVVEANRKSGSLLTANKALKLGKEVGTLPCSPMEPNSQGNLDLLYDGAHLIRDAADMSFLT